MFSDQLASWGAFATLLGGAAATLMGLLFIAVSLNSGAVSDAGDKEIRLMAVTTFAGFLFLLIYALNMLIPNQSPSSLGWSLLITSIFQSRVSFQEAARIWHSRAGRAQAAHILWRQVLPLASALLIAVVGILLVGGWSTDLDNLLYAYFALLIGSTLNAWFLLLRINAPSTSGAG